MRGPLTAAPAAALESRFGEVAQAIAAVLVIAILPTTFLYMAPRSCTRSRSMMRSRAPRRRSPTVLGDDRVVWLRRASVGIGLVCSRCVTRGEGDGRPRALLAMGVVCLAPRRGAHGLERFAWTGFSLTVVVTAPRSRCWVAWIVRRALTPARAAAIGVALLIAALFDQRTFVEDPLEWAFGFAGLAFVLFGFVWALLTGGGRANGNSRRYPRSSRVLLFLANALFGVTVLAFAALARDPDATVNLSAPLLLGDELLGTGLLAAALLAALATALEPSARAARVDSPG